MLTLETERKGGKPFLVIDFAEIDHNRDIADISEWLSRIAPAKLNVAGPRASKDPAIYDEAMAILLAVFSDLERPDGALAPRTV